MKKITCILILILVIGFGSAVSVVAQELKWGCTEVEYILTEIEMDENGFRLRWENMSDEDKAGRVGQDFLKSRDRIRNQNALKLQEALEREERAKVK